LCPINKFNKNSYSNTLFLSSSEDKTVRLWDTRLNYSCHAFVDKALKNSEIGNLTVAEEGNKFFWASGN